MPGICTNCGTDLGAFDAFCGNCGQPVPSETDPLLLPAAADAGATGPGVLAAVGEAAPNAVYVGTRMMYDKTPEPGFDPLSNVRFLTQMAQRAALYLVIFLFGATAGIVFFLVVGLVAIGLADGLTLFGVCAAAVALVLLAAFWFIPLPVQLSEWKFSVDGKAAAAPVVFEHIAWVLRERRTPLDSLRVRRLRLPGEGVRDYLELSRGLFTGYVACFANGMDLYVGWTFWFRLSPFRYVLMVLGRIWQSVINRGNDLYVTLRYDSARAMRESMHSAAREGIDVAVGQLPAQLHGLIGGAVTVADVVV
jgi:hypothetical protein